MHPLKTRQRQPSTHLNRVGHDHHGGRLLRIATGGRADATRRSKMTFTGTNKCAWLGKATLAGLVVLSLAACSKAGDGPTEKDISNALALKLPAGIEVDDLDIQVSENMGNKVEPDYETRSNVTLKLTDDFYQVVRHVLDKDVVHKTFSKGQTIDGTLITDATMQGDHWNITFKRMDVANVTGTPGRQFAPNSYVLDDSSDYKALLQKQAQQEADQAKEAAVEQAKEAKEKAARIDVLRKQIVGAWVAREPAIHNGASWAANNGNRLGIELTLNPGTDTSGDGTGVIYNFNNPGNQVSVPVGYVLDDSGQFATITFGRDVTLQSVGFEVGPSGPWKLSGDGKLTIGPDNNNWLVVLEKNGPALADWKTKVARAGKLQQEAQELSLKYNAAVANDRFGSLGLSLNSFGYFWVTGKTDGQIWGGHNVYGFESDVGTAAVHAGLLKPGQSGVIKIQRGADQSGFFFPSVAANGITSSSRSGRRADAYAIQLVQAVPLN